ncbi:hypothetical protein K2P56_02960 [Patescibacteria group bacterium]|nr:hypothetical protein [Patescibacteria group bacterium]
MITILLAKVIGLYLAVGGLGIILKQKEIRAAERHFKSEGMLRFSLALLVTMLGLFYVVGYSDFTTFVAGFLTVFGWIILLKGLMLLFIDGGSLDALIKRFDNKQFYYGAGAVMIIFGLYLAGFGFGFLW